MSWVGAGLDVLKTICETINNQQLNQATRERDSYKQKAEVLSSQLDQMKKEKNTNGHEKHNFRGNKRGNSQTSRNHSKPVVQDNFATGKKTSGGGRGYPGRQNSSGQGARKPSNFQNNTMEFHGTFVGTFVDANPTSASAARARGGSHSRGRGRGKAFVPH